MDALRREYDRSELFEREKNGVVVPVKPHTINIWVARLAVCDLAAFLTTSISAGRLHTFLICFSVTPRVFFLPFSML